MIFGNFGEEDAAPISYSTSTIPSTDWSSPDLWQSQTTYTPSPLVNPISYSSESDSSSSSGIWSSLASALKSFSVPKTTQPAYAAPATPAWVWIAAPVGAGIAFLTVLSMMNRPASAMAGYKRRRR